MSPTQYSDFRGLLYRRYKSHMLCFVLCCTVVFCLDDLYRLQNSPSGKCCV
nr:MAG TPA: hypothetical protein [Caudoviricetes sp.]